MNRQQAMDRIERLENDLLELQKSNRSLNRQVRKLTYTKKQKTVMQAHTDAKALLNLAINNVQITREFCLSLGISERRYYWALGLLRYSGIFSQHGKRLRVRNTEEIVSTLAQTSVDLINDRSALNKLRRFTPKK